MIYPDNPIGQNELALRYEFLTGEKYKLIHLPRFCAFDCVRYNKELKQGDAFMELKNKRGPFEDTEIFPYIKTDFVRSCKTQCYFVVERNQEVRVFDITNIVRWFDDGISTSKIIKKEVIRHDRPRDAQDWFVLEFPTEWGVII